MLHKLWYAFGTIFNRKRIPPLPRGMFAAEYEDINSPERGVMARMGARDPIGVHLAMKRAGVDTPEELAALLKHYQPQRHMIERIKTGIGRLLGGLDYDPHAEDIRRIDSAYFKRKARGMKEIDQRVKTTRKAFEEKNR